MSCQNQSGAGLLDKFFKKKPTPTKFAKAVRSLDYKKVLELIKKGADVNAKYRGKKPLEIVLDAGIAMHNKTEAEETIIALIHNGSVITRAIYQQYKEKEESIEYLLENGTHLDAMDFDETDWDDEWESMAYDENDTDELEVMKVLTGAYEKALKKYQKKQKKAIRKGIEGKKGMEIGIADIIGKMAIGAGKKRKRKPKKGGGKKFKKTAKQMREVAKKGKKSKNCKCKNCKCKNCKCKK